MDCLALKIIFAGDRRDWQYCSSRTHQNNDCSGSPMILSSFLTFCAVMIVRLRNSDVCDMLSDQGVGAKSDSRVILCMLAL